MAEPPPSPGPDGGSGEWDSLSFGAPDPPARRRGKLVAGVLGAGVLGAGVLALAGSSVGSALFGASGAVPRIASVTAHPAPPSTHTGLDGSSKPLRTGPPRPAPSAPPTALGTNPNFDRFARECYGGAMHSCDVLFVVSPPRSRYEAYGDSCAGRQRHGTHVFCAKRFPGP
jgi:hypothetical protein